MIFGIFFILSICAQLKSEPLDIFSVVQCCRLVQRIDYFYANRLFFNSLDILFCIGLHFFPVIIRYIYLPFNMLSLVKGRNLIPKNEMFLST